PVGYAAAAGLPAAPAAHPAEAVSASEPTGTADAWTETVILAGAKPAAWYADGPAAGGPAVTRHDLGAGRAWYVSARTAGPTTAAGLAAACDSAGLLPPARPAGRTAGESRPSAAASASGLPGQETWPRDLELVRRTDGQRRFTMLINHGETPATVQLPTRT